VRPDIHRDRATEQSRLITAREEGTPWKKPRPIIPLVLMGANLAQVQPVSADTLRCGSVLIEPGDDAAYVLERCGEPKLLRAGGPTVLARDISPGIHPAAILRAGRWLYHRGPGKFPALLTIGDDGRVEDIQFEMHRD